MKPITEWISSVEVATAKLYLAVADYFSDDAQFSSMVRNMAKEEEEHYELILRAINVLGGSSAEINVDLNTRLDYERPLLEGNARLKDGTLTKELFIAIMVELEFSLYNEIFIYAMNLARESGSPLSKEIVGINTMLRHHRLELENFLSSREDYKKYLKTISRIPEPWHKRVLVVDDSEALAEFFKAVLEGVAHVDVAYNGKEGIEKLSNHHYDLVVSDVEMPIVSGIEFFELALSKDSSFKDRFIFCLNDDMSNDLIYLKANELKFIVKPVDIVELLTLVKESIK